MGMKNRLNLLGINAFLWMIIGLYMPFLSSFLMMRGITPSEIGIIIAIYPLFSILVVPFWGKVSDRMENKKIVITIVCIGIATSGLLFYLSLSFVTFLLSASLFCFFLVALTPLLDTIVTNICKENNLKFSVFRIGGTIGYALIVLVYGFVLNQYPQLQFISISALALILILLLGRVEVPKRSQETKVHKGKKVFTSRNIYFVIAVATICQFGVSFIGNFMGVFLIEEGISRSMIGVLNFTSAFSEIPILLTIDRLLRRCRVDQILLFALVTLVIRILLFSTASIPLMILSQLLQSTSYMLVYYTSIDFVVNHVITGKEVQGQSLLFTAQNGFGAILSSVLGGWLLGLAGARESFWLMALLISIILVGLIVWRKLKFGGKEDVSEGK